MRDRNTHFDLEAYLRLHRGTGDEWLAAMQDLLWPSDLHCRLANPQSVAGSLSMLEADAGHVCVLDIHQDMTFTGRLLERPMVVLSVEGRCNITLNGSRLPAYPLIVIPEDMEFTLSVDGLSQLVLLLPSGKLPQLCSVPDEAQAVASEIRRFMFMAEYLRGHQHACKTVNDLFRRVKCLLAREHPGSLAEPPQLDRRLVRAIEKIRTESEWEFNLQELAKHAGASERNLYYLMKREAGFTPYRYYQRCRLIRVRRRLVSCECDDPHISWYAADEGFSHLGRFAALYKEHFGELPSETVQWRRRLQAQCHLSA
ncbi:helix-turn-helix domain-containing protein [Marinobacter sp.]|uniref:helix-turn-helix domain-containing protein n=1 Tax=Marinobacter sp. TaxID=50741 RepID=UPI0035669DDB